MQLPKNGIVQSKILNKHSTFTLISFYWGNDRVNKGSVHGLTYGEQTQRIIRDCERLKINYYFVRYPSLERPGTNYMEALALKPKFIKHCLKKFPDYKCIFVDTDMRIMSYPHMFEADADCFFINWNEFDYNCYNPLQLELPGAILGFSNTQNSRKLLDILIDNLHPKHAEDKTFSGIITRNFLNVHFRCVWLPSSYLYMFEKHVYEPGKGYTKVASYSEELKGTGLKKSDLVFVHEDFETGMLDDLFNERIKDDRYPPKTDQYLGEKLRCYDIKFEKYTDWGLNSYQQKQYTNDNKEKIKNRVIRLKKIKKVSTGDLPKYTVSSTRIYKTDKFVCISIVDNDTDMHTIKRFRDSCREFKVNHMIVKVHSKVNKAYVLYNVMKRIDNDIVYVDINDRLKNYPKIFDRTQMDFMTVNLNNEYKQSKCYDPRILKTKSDDIYYFSNNDIVKQFLLIWGEHNRSTFIKSGLQHKSLEYAFNISNAVNKMRCYWVSDKETGIRGSKSNHTYQGLPGKTKVLTKGMEQCGIKPPRSSSMEARRSHYKGSRGKAERSKYAALFV